MQKVRDVGDILRATEDYKAAEPVLQEALSIVQSCPEQQSQFEKAFISILADPEHYSPLVVEYCMHVLRFPAVRQYVEARLSRDPLRIDSNARHVLDAYSDRWRLASVFKRTLGRPR